MSSDVPRRHRLDRFLFPEQNRKTKSISSPFLSAQLLAGRGSAEAAQCVPAVIKRRARQKAAESQLFRPFFWRARCRCTRPPSTVKNSHYLSWISHTPVRKNSIKLGPAAFYEWVAIYFADRTGGVFFPENNVLRYARQTRFRCTTRCCNVAMRSKGAIYWR